MAGIASNSGFGAAKGGLLVSALVALIAVTACQPDSPTGALAVGDIGLAKGGSGGGGGGGGGGGVAPTITATDPASTVQDTTLDVAIIGTGFTNGAKAKWSLAGDTTQVIVKSTKVVGADRIIARITVPATAAVGSYDVIVTLSNGKQGVGAEMFEVQIGDPTATFQIPTDDLSLGLRGDGLYPSGGTSVYAYGVCGVNSKIFATEAASNSGDAIMHTNNPRHADRRCAAYPRTVTIEYAPNDIESSTVFINVRSIANTAYQIPIGTTARHELFIGGTRCDGLRFTGVSDGINTGADSVNVTRVDASTWLVESRPSPDNKAYCRATGQLHHVNVRFTVVTDRALP